MHWPKKPGNYRAKSVSIVNFFHVYFFSTMTFSQVRTGYAGTHNSSRQITVTQHGERVGVFLVPFFYFVTLLI